jgi:hypothetical protein
MSAIKKITAIVALLSFQLLAEESVLLDKVLLEGFGTKLAYYRISDLQKNFLHSVELKRKVTSVELSLNKKIVLVKTDKEAKSEFYGIDISSKKVLFRSPVFDSVVGYYWMDDCHFAVLQNNKAHGGTLQSNPLPAAVVDSLDLKCDKLEISLDKVPVGELPKLLIKMDEANLWAYFHNGSRAVVPWLSDGLTFDFSEGKEGQYYFREASEPSKIYLANYKTQKVTDFYKGDGYFKSDKKGRVVMLDYSNKKLLLIEAGKSKVLINESVVSFVLDQDKKAVFARLENGTYRYLKI